MPNAFFSRLLLVQSVIQTMAYANSCVNPILYGWLSFASIQCRFPPFEGLLSERFRLAFRRTLSRLCCVGMGEPGGSIPFPASLANLSTLRCSPPSYLPSKRPSSTLTQNGYTASSRRESGANGINNGWFGSGETAVSRQALFGESKEATIVFYFRTASLSPSAAEEERKRSTQSAVQLMTTWSKTRLETLGEESRACVEDSEGEEDVVLL